MRILHVIATTDPEGGGVIEAVKQIARSLEPLGAQVEVLSMDDPDQSPWLADFPLPVHATGPAQGRFGFSPRTETWLRENGKDYHHIVVDGLWQHNGLAVWKARKMHGRPYFVFSHGMLDPWFRRTYPLKHLKKQIYWWAGQYRVLRDAQALLYTCEEERLQAQKAFVPWGPFREKVVAFGTAGLPVDPEAARAAFYEAFPNLQGKRILLYLSRIHEKKGCDLLIRSFAKYAALDPELHLVMAGPDQTGWQATLEAIAREGGVADRIVWTGMISGDVKWGAYLASEAFVLPSHQENFGIVVAEALSCRRPVLISNKVNIWREIETGGGGIVANDDQAGMDKLLARWLALGLDDRLEMGERAFACFERHFEIGHAAKSLMDLYAAVA